MERPWQSRTITPMQALVPSLEVAPSTFILKKPEGGAFHLRTRGEWGSGGGNKHP